MTTIFRQSPTSADRPKRGPAAAAFRVASLVFILGFATNVLCAARVLAQDNSDTLNPPSKAATPPMPPARPSVLALPPKAPVAAAPPQAPAAAQAAEEKPAVDPGPGEPLKLPPYTRARMHECALEWQKMKATGAATEKIWFTFAQTCLVR
jgi:hypothetical protein